MQSLFSFEGELDRRAFAVRAASVFFASHVFVVATFALLRQSFVPSVWFWLSPLRTLSQLNPFPGSVVLSAMLLTLTIDWLLAAFVFRRLRHAGGNAAFSVFSIIPFLQSPLIVALCLAPHRRLPEAEHPPSTAGLKARAIMVGLLLGVALCLGAVALSTLVFRTYGYGLFVASPFVIGFSIAYIANRNVELAQGETMRTVMAGLLLGAIALAVFAVEGIVCLVVASPLIAAIGAIGCWAGRTAARQRREGPNQLVMGIAILPLLIGGETAFPPRASFDSVESIEIAAPPATVWDAVVHMGPIPDPPPAPFRWGLAYPVRGEIFGSGVGAVREGVFSTGVAYERVTEWAPGRKLSFIVLSDPPTMRELSPYAHVNAPHVIGYFRTRDARFVITPLPNGRTRLSLATHHELDLEPALYWLPIAEWATHVNKVRVLQHFRQQAEAASASG